MSRITRTIHPEVKIIDAAKGIVDYIASDESIDSYREVIKADGWRFSRFRQNAPFVDSHDYSCIDKLLGKVTDFRVEGSKLIERVQWAIDVPDHKLAQLGFKLTEAGYLKAVSVGFFPIRRVHKWDTDTKPFEDTIAGLGLSVEDAMRVCCVYLEQEQIELSTCIIGANPNALAKAYKADAISEEDLDFVARIAQADTTFSDNHAPITASPAEDPAGAGLARRQERAAWLKEFRDLVNA